MKVIAPGDVEIDLGTVETTPTVGIIDYSRRVTDDFGVTTIVPRSFARRMSVRLALPFDEVDDVQQSLAALRATPAQWVADDRFDWLNFEGFFKDFELDLAVPPLSFCTLTIEGLAESEPGVDTGEDAAPGGSASTFHLLDPVAITDAMLTATNIAEAEWPNWSAGLTYALGDRVLKTSTHRVYESAIDGNTGNDPEALSGQWIDIGPTRRWAMFDQALGTASFRFDSIVVTLDPGTVDAVALLDVVGATVRVQTTGYDETKAVTAGTISFLDLPGVDAPITVTILGPGTVSVGTLLVGSLSALGITGDAPTAGIIDFSRKEVDDFGEVMIVERAWSKRMSARTLISTGAVDLVANRIAAVRARPALWIGDGGTDALTIYGFFKDFSIEVGENVSTLSLSVEGLSEAAPVSTGLPPVNWPDVVDSDPAQPKPEDGATVGAPVGTPVGDRPAEQVNAEIDAALAQIDDLFETYGDTVSASIAAGLAADARDAAIAAAAEADGYAEVTETARDEAQSFASAAHAEAVTAGDAASASQASAAAASAYESSASTSADLSATYRDQAEGHKNTAQAQAGIATTQAAAATASASSASASETLTAAYRDTARLQAANLIPSTFAQDGTHFFAGYDGAPATRTPLLPYWWGNYTDVTGVGRVAQVTTSASFDISNIGVMQVRAGRAYRATIRYRTLTGTRPITIYMITLNANHEYLGVADTNVTSTATTTWQSISVTLTGDALLAAGSSYIRCLARAGAGADTVQWAVCGVEDVTESERATAQASIATSQAAIATAEAAAAVTNTLLSAGFGKGYINPNPNFAYWPDATGLPSISGIGGWDIWQGGAMGGANRRLTMAQMGITGGRRPENSDYVYAPFNTSASQEIGLLINPDLIQITPGRQTVEATAQLMDGTYVGSGVLVYMFDGASNYQGAEYIRFWADADMNGVTGNGGFNLRRWSKSFVTASNCAFIRLYAMGNWGGFPTNATAAKALAFYNVGLKAGNAADATVATHASVLATHDTKLASWLQRVAAGPGYAQIKMTALDSNGATATVIDMAADRITLGLTTVLEVVAGKVTVNGDLYVQNGKIVLDTGTHMKVIGNGFGSASQFVEWFGPNMAINLCSEANAITFIKTNGEAYYGGGFASGALRNGLGTSGLSTTQSVLLGPFGTNGNPITVAVSWIYRTEITKTYAANSSGRSIFDADVATYGATHQGSDFYSGQTTATRPSSTLQLERQIAPGALGFVTQQATTVETMSFSGTRPTLSGDPGDATTGTIIQYSAISFTYTDTAGGTGNRSFRATINRGYTYGAGAVTQNISIVTTEA